MNVELLQYHGRSFFCENSEELEEDENSGEAMIQNLERQYSLNFFFGGGDMGQYYQGNLVYEYYINIKFIDLIILSLLKILNLIWSFLRLVLFFVFRIASWFLMMLLKSIIIFDNKNINK